MPPLSPAAAQVASAASRFLNAKGQLTAEDVLARAVRARVEATHRAAALDIIKRFPKDVYADLAQHDAGVTEAVMPALTASYERIARRTEQKAGWVARAAERILGPGTGAKVDAAASQALAAEGDRPYFLALANHEWREIRIKPRTGMDVPVNGAMTKGDLVAAPFTFLLDAAAFVGSLLDGKPRWGFTL